MSDTLNEALLLRAAKLARGDNQYRDTATAGDQRDGESQRLYEADDLQRRLPYLLQRHI